MKTIINSLNASETLQLISKQWASTNDIKKLNECGNNKALQIKNAIAFELKNWCLPPNKVPMSKVVEFLKIDINYLRKVAKESEK